MNEEHPVANGLNSPAGETVEETFSDHKTVPSPTLFHLAKLVELAIVLTQNVLAFRIAFRFLGLTEANIGVKFFYLFTEPLVKPFLNLMPWLTDTSANSVLEGGSIIVLFVLIFMNYLINRLVIGK